MLTIRKLLASLFAATGSGFNWLAEVTRPAGGGGSGPIKPQ